MRKTLFASSFLLIVSLAMAQTNKEETITGNGKLIKKDVNVQPFDALKANGLYELKLKQGDKESVKIEADENLQDLFYVHNDGSKLIIEMKKMEHKNLKLNDKIRVYVTFRKLKSINISTIGNVTAEGQLSFDDLELANRGVGNIDMKLTANKIEVKNTGVGNIDLEGKADNAFVYNTGVGAIKASHLLVQNMNIENTGVGSADVNVEKQCKVKDSFIGKVRNTGSAHIRKMNKVVI